MDNLIIKITSLYRKVVSLCFFTFGIALVLGTFTGCSEQKVVYPVDIVKPSEEVESDEAGDEVEDEVEENEETEEEEQEFNQLEDDETETSASDDGTVLTEDGKPVIDLIFFMGQSNMSGAGGNVDLAPKVLDGHGYEFRAVSDPTKLYNIEEPFGKNESFIGGICDLPGAKKGSIVSCFANEYYRQTGVPIVGVSASQGATTTEIWQTLGFQTDMTLRYNKSVEWLEENGYYIRNRYAIWFQGESDAANHVDPEVYNTNMDNIIRPLFILGLNKVFIVTPGRTLSIKNYFDDIVNQQLTMCRDSGYYALGTNILSKVSSEYMVDEWHYNQLVLNLIGIETAKSVAYVTLHHTERIDYDYMNKKPFIPNGYEYPDAPEEVEVEPLDLSDIQKLLDEYWDEYTSEAE